jgi:hypothetical protein
MAEFRSEIRGGVKRTLAHGESANTNGLKM